MTAILLGGVWCATAAITSAARSAAPSVSQRDQSGSRAAARSSSPGHSPGAGNVSATSARPALSTWRALSFCSTKGRGWGSRIPGVRVTARSAIEFCPPAVTTTPAVLSSSVGSSTRVSPAR